MIVKADYLNARWDEETQARFWSKVQRGGDTDCWTWTGSLSPKGYAQISIDSRRYAAHRLLLVKQRNDPLEGLVCDHLCRTRACVNPRHIEPVTNSENIRRGDAPLLNKLNGRKITHCPQGHAYTPENTRLGPRGGRSCRACDRKRTKAWNALRAERSARDRSRSPLEDNSSHE